MAQTKDKLQVVCDTGDAYTLVGRSCELSAFSYVPTTHQVPKERTYFNTDKKVCKSRTHVQVRTVCGHVNGYRCTAC